MAGQMFITTTRWKVVHNNQHYKVEGMLRMMRGRDDLMNNTHGLRPLLRNSLLTAHNSNSSPVCKLCNGFQIPGNLRSHIANRYHLSLHSRCGWCGHNLSSSWVVYYNSWVLRLRMRWNEMNHKNAPSARLCWPPAVKWRKCIGFAHRCSALMLQLLVSKLPLHWIHNINQKKYVREVATGQETDM